MADMGKDEAKNNDNRDSDQHSQNFYASSADQVLQHFETNAQEGLSKAEARRRLERHGPNQLQEAKSRSLWVLLLAQFKSIVIIILAVAAVIAFATARWPEGFALLAVTMINTAIGFFSEWKAVRSMEALRAMSEQKTLVRRDGGEQEVESLHMVPGDIALIRPETLAAADIRLLEVSQLRVNEAALTGESVPVHKTVDEVDDAAELADRTNMLYKGTSVVEGSAVGIVVATGTETELGRISELAQQADDRAQPLQQKLDRLGQQLAWITLAIAAIVGISGLIAGRDTVTMIETAIALGIAAVPEGLPIVATIALARGMWKMAQRNALVRQLTAVETLGATRVIFTDKTGTLTENRMTMDLAVTSEGRHSLTEQNSKGRSEQHNDKGQEDTADNDTAQPSDVLSQMVRVGVLCNNARLSDDGSDSGGDPTEVALLEAGRRFGIRREELLEKLPETHEISFDPDVMMMATYHKTDDGFLVAVKGSPEAVLENCTRIAGNREQASGDEANGSSAEREFTDSMREDWHARSQELASEGLRLLAMADKRVDSQDAEAYQDLRFLGLAGLFDPPRTEITQAIQECQQAGIRVIMVTGDRPDTGLAIGRKVGLTDNDSAMRGSELSDWESLSKSEQDRLLQTNVFARVTPAQKLQLVRLYQDHGEIVAMTGDGVNDAPALKQADIGIAMGKRGTDAARQMADMVLRDDQFSSIVAAVHQGRVIFANIRKSVIFMLCTNLAEILVVSAASLAQAPIPLKPLQILYLNVLTDVFPALALGVGPGAREVMRRPPRNPDESVLTRHHWQAIGAWSVGIGACVLTALGLALRWLGYDDTTAVTVSFLTLGFSKLWFVVNLRDRGSSVLNNDVVKNPWIWVSIAVCSVLLLAAVYWPWLAEILKTNVPGTNGWILILVMSLIPIGLGVFVPGIRFHTYRADNDAKSE